jgi:TPR repeat protein
MNTNPYRAPTPLLPVWLLAVVLLAPPLGANAATSDANSRLATQAASAAEDPAALVVLATRYQRGQGVPRDLAQAAALYERAAKLGNAEAQFNLGNMYLLGEGVPRDDDWAFTWFREAAQQGHPLAKKNVDQFYKAAGMRPPAEGAAPMEPEGAGELPGAPTAAAAMNNNDDDVMPSKLPNAPVPVPDEVSVDEMNALELARSRGIRLDAVPEATEPAPPIAPVEAALAPPASDDPQLAQARAQLAAGKPLAALPLLQQQAEAGSPEAQWLLSQVLTGLKRTPADQTAAWQWLERAASAGWRDAQYALGLRYDRGEGVTPDEAEAVTWYRAAARQGHAAAFERLRVIYRNAGLPVPALDIPAPSSALDPTSAIPSVARQGSFKSCNQQDCTRPAV